MIFAVRSVGIHLGSKTLMHPLLQNGRTAAPGSCTGEADDDIFPGGMIPTEGEEMAFIIVDGAGRATLPEEVRRELGLDGGDASVVILEKTERGTYELIPAALVPRDQLWFYSEEVQAGIAAAEADFRSGRSVDTSSPEEAQAHLDGLKRR